MPHSGFSRRLEIHSGLCKDERADSFRPFRGIGDSSYDEYLANAAVRNEDFGTVQDVSITALFGAPASSSGHGTPRNPSAPMRRTFSQRNLPSASSLAATGATWSRANPRTVSRTARFCSEK